MIITEKSSADTKESKRKVKKLSKKARRILIISIICALFVSFIISLIISNFSIKINDIEIESKSISNPVRIALISDLHSREFGDDNEKLYKKISGQNPDIILVTGDMLSSSATEEKGKDYLSRLSMNLSKIAPVYFSIGNHDRDVPYVRSSIENSGGTLLDKEYLDITLKENKIRIGGLSYYRYWDDDSNEFLRDFSDTPENTFTLLLCHNPEFYLWGIKNYPIDLTVCGHTHGGMMKVPLKGPLYAPEQGWFPDYAAGLYSMKNGYLAVTTGLASSPEYMPRIFNRPEIMIIDLE